MIFFLTLKVALETLTARRQLAYREVSNKPHKSLLHGAICVLEWIPTHSNIGGYEAAEQHPKTQDFLMMSKIIKSPISMTMP